MVHYHRGRKHNTVRYWKGVVLMKRSLVSVLVAVLLLTLCASALADTAPYIRYISSGKGVGGSATHTSNSKVYVTQTSNVNTETGATGPKINYGARKTRTTSGSSICGSISVSGYSGSDDASYKSGKKPSSGSTVYLVVQPSKTASTGQWEIAGTWSP